MPDRKILPPHQLPETEDDLDIQESKALEEGEDLKKQAELREHQRQEKVRDLTHSVAKIAIVVLLIILVSGVITWAWHLLTPYHLHWLNEKQLIKIQEAMSSALIAILVSEYARRYF